ncbi:tyrosine-type recombinase/integrase [Roseovarius sp. SYSU LYC5161]|uniref:tyrosine-type recombinase/integrase n=1 Tax=Roseovarius halophilus (ex Wu et al. 2025) TaxID=3376060 RepID=UPI00399C0DF1
MARGKNILTAVQVRKARPGRHQDGGGLILHKTEHGGRWLWRYSFGGRRREMGLGGLDAITLAQARAARDKWAAVLAHGRDPISERDREIDAQRAEMQQDEPTFAEVAEMVFEARKAGLREDGKRGRWWSPLRLHVIPKIGSMSITRIHQRDLHKALAPIWQSKHPTAEKALQRTGIVMRQARFMGYDVDPFLVEAARHMLGEVRHETAPITATPWQDMPALWRRLDGYGYSVLCLKFVILTVMRPGAVRWARFSEIDAANAVWTVPADRMKAREGKARPFRVPLTDASLEVVARCKEAASTDLLFPSYKPENAITDVALSKALNTLGEAGRAHGFRSTFRTWVQDTDAANYDVAETALGHVIGGRVERSYARSDLLDRRRALMQQWAYFVTSGSASS